MPDYLATKDWKAVLDLKEHKSVKKTGISDTLEEFAAAKKKDDLGRMASALTKIVEKAGEVKSAQAKYPKLAAYLAEAIKAAKAEQQKLAPRLAQIGQQGDDEDNEDSTLGKQLAKIRQVDVDSAWNFVVVPGKPSSGFVVSKKTLKKSDTEKAFEMKGKRGPFFTGRIFFEAGKFVLDLGPEVSPVPGLAKSAKNAAALHAEMNIKVVVRGMGKEIDADTDIEPLDEGGGTTGEAPLTSDSHFVQFETRIDQVAQAIDRFVQSATVKVDGAGDALQSAVGLLGRQIAADQKMNDHAKGRLTARLVDLQQTLKDATKPATVNPAAKYPTEAQWKTLADQVIRLEPGKAEEGWKRFRAQHTKYMETFTKDADLKDPERSQVQQTLLKALDLMGKAIASTKTLAETAAKDSGLARRIAGVERKLTQVENAPGLNSAAADQVRTALTNIQTLFNAGKIAANDQQLARLEQAVEALAGRAFKANAEVARKKGQQEMHASLSQALPFLKKAALPVGMVKNPDAIRAEVGANPSLKAMLDKMAAAAKAPGKQAGQEMEAAAREIVKIIVKRNDEAEANGKTAPDLSAGEQLAVDVLKRAQMMQLSADYEALGAPPWDPAKTDIASELQAQLFFLEGSIAQGKPTYEAPNLGSAQGASGSWWIERQEQTGAGGTAGKKKYIFKPAQKEGAVMAGLAPGAGAPREVLAKRLDEFMAASGFNVGVCPTTLASIDGGQLESTGVGGPLLGSMQQLAETEGPVSEKLKKDPEAVKRIDKKSFDNVAAFDMIFANLDRHSKNVHTKTDPATGAIAMIPIDHGSGLLPPDRLQANATAMLPPMNIMADPNLPQANEPLGAEAQEALARLDPDQMVAEMKKARDDMARRHPETAGTMSDAAIEGMGARVRFLKAAAPDTPVADLFKMLATGAKRIGEADAKDIPALVKTLKQEAADYDKAMEVKASLDKVLSAVERTPSNAVITELQRLGWAWNLTSSEFDDWFLSNRKLVGRVLAGRIENPELVREADRLSKIAQTIDPVATRKADSDPIQSRYLRLYSIANSDIVSGPGKDAKLDALKSEFAQLGGEAELARAALDFPNDFKNCMTPPKDTKPKSMTPFMRERVMLMRQWAAFKAKGGIDAITAEGVTIPRMMTMVTGIRTIDELTLSKKARADVEGMDDDEVDAHAERQYAKLTKEVPELLKQERHPVISKTHQNSYDLGQKAWADGEKIAGLTLIGRVKATVEKQIRDELAFEKEIDVLEQQLLDTLAKADKAVRDELQQHMPTIQGYLQQARQTAVIGTRDRGKNEFDLRMDTVLKGKDSRLSKARAGVDALEKRLAAQAAMPWGAAAAKLATGIRTNLDDYDLAKVESPLEWLPRALDAVDKISAAVGNADPNSLPPEVQTIVQAWVARLPANSEIDKADQDAARIRELLGATVA